ncbi:MAG: large subunit ribosomal protein [Chthoniobacter sp.]|jgi:large subunit ribosomal protein L25|nr:large subunit ribosomal protein [Chthoniobacter sp.]
MAKQVKLSAQTRPHVGRSAVNKLKSQGIVPAIIYGGKTAPQPLQVAARDIKTLLSHAVGENILVELEIDDAGKKSSRVALIQEVQHAPISRDVLHVDFHAINMNETLRASIPIEPTGEANGVKNFGGILEQSLRELEVECLPKDLPEIITVDVSGLNIGDSIHVSHLILPSGVTADEDPELTVFLCAPPTVEVEPVAATEVAAGPEVINEKKEESAAESKEKK